MVRTVFLSHAGADTAAADALRKRLEGAGFDVWFDKRDLRAGHKAWQEQLEEAIEKVDGFVVYVGTRGVVNWVEAETRYALSRAISGKRKLAFVPVLSARVKSTSKALPGFARQFQAIRDDATDPAEWKRLIAGLTAGAPPPKEEEPFFHLKPISADRNHLFFGRRHETGQIAHILRDRNLVLVSGASGSGKSSLVRAGLIPAWRGNSVGLLRGEHPEQCDWLTITMTPGDSPWENLGRAVTEAAEEERGLSPTQAAEFAILAQNDSQVVKERALRLNAERDKARVLLVVDQFEELFVRNAITPDTRKSFAEFLARLADPANPTFAVALTMRSDYTNHLGNNADVQALQARLQAQDGRARFNLRSILMSNPDDPSAGSKSLREVVTGPLALAGRTEAEAEALADMVLRDAGGDAGDLALVQFALSETWAQRGNNGDDLLKAYVSVGRVEGALVKAADAAVENLVQRDLATESEAEAALIRLGSLIGASPLRRTAQRSEFTDPRWAALQFLASIDGKRLVQITGEGDTATVEIAHEALLTQWLRLNGWLSRDPEGKRLLDGLIQRTREVAEGPPARRIRSRSLQDMLMSLHNLAIPDPGGPVMAADDAKRYSILATDHADWLTPEEATFLQRSRTYAEAMERREKRLVSVIKVWVGTLVVAFTVMTYLWRDSLDAEHRASLSAQRTLAALVDLNLALGNERNAALLYLSSEEVHELSRSPNLGSPQFERSLAVFSANQFSPFFTGDMTVVVDRDVLRFPLEASFSSDASQLVFLYPELATVFDFYRAEYLVAFNTEIVALAQLRKSIFEQSSDQSTPLNVSQFFDLQGETDCIIRTSEIFDLINNETGVAYEARLIDFSVSRDSYLLALLFQDNTDILVAVFSRESCAAPIFSSRFNGVGYRAGALDFIAETQDLLVSMADGLSILDPLDFTVVKVADGMAGQIRRINAYSSSNVALLIEYDGVVMNEGAYSASVLWWDIDAALGSSRLHFFCELIGAVSATELTEIDRDTGRTNPEICTREQRALPLPPIWVPSTPIYPLAANKE